MTLKEKLKWEGQIAVRLKNFQDNKSKIESGEASQHTYYWFVGEAVSCAVEIYLEGDAQRSKAAAQDVVGAVLDYFYGGWQPNCPLLMATLVAKRGNSFVSGMMK